MEDFANITLVADLTLLQQRVQTATNYADAGSQNPSADAVLVPSADAEVCSSLLRSAQLRVHELLGRWAKNVEQPVAQPDKWMLTLRVPACNNYPLLASQLNVAVEDLLVADVVAHWLALVATDRADAAMNLWLDAQQHLKELALWRAKPPKITPVFL